MNKILRTHEKVIAYFKGPLPGLRQFLESESSLKITFLFYIKAFFVLKVFAILSWYSGHVGKAKVNFKIFDFTNWIANNCNTIFLNNSGSNGNQAMKYGQLIEYYVRKISVQKSWRKWGREPCSWQAFMRWKQLLRTVALLYFDGLRLKHRIKTNL